MREKVLIRALALHDQAINKLGQAAHAVDKNIDRMYVHSLTHEMMWDVLMTLLTDKHIFTRQQFDDALKDAYQRAKKAQEAAEKAKAEEIPAGGRITVISDKPEVEIVH